MYKQAGSQLSQPSAPTYINVASPSLESLDTSDSDNFTLSSSVHHAELSSLSVEHNISSPGNLPSSPETCQKPECHKLKIR